MPIFNSFLASLKGTFQTKAQQLQCFKMDEFQQRLNTPSALVRQGQEKRH